jgi:hypothetical protein
MYRYFAIVVVGLCVASSARANTWADGLFDSLSKDFGSVPNGQIVSHPFRVINNTGSPVRIIGVRVSCDCVKAYALKQVLQPNEETAVMAQMDTGRFLNSRTVTIFVTFDTPAFAEVRLWVRATSREDISVVPDTLVFGAVKRGATPNKSVTISLLGNPNHRILQVSCDSNYVQPLCKLVRNNNFEVVYDLSATLRSDTPPGKWFTDVWVTTNIPALPKLRVPLTVEVQSALSVSPNNILMGKVKPNTERVQKIVVRGIEPFRVLGVKGVDKQIQVFGDTTQAKTIHVLSVTFRPSDIGPFDRTLFIQTDLKADNLIDFTAHAQVGP